MSNLGRRLLEQGDKYETLDWRILHMPSASTPRGTQSASVVYNCILGRGQTATLRRDEFSVRYTSSHITLSPGRPGANSDD